MTATGFSLFFSPLLDWCDSGPIPNWLRESQGEFERGRSKLKSEEKEDRLSLSSVALVALALLLVAHSGRWAVDPG